MKFRAALGFFTRLPIGSAPLPPTFRGVAVWLPVVGLIIGALVSLALGLAAQLLPASLCGVIGCLVWVAVTGGLHLDGVADCGDGLIVEAPPARRLEIMKDSRLGTFGGAALFFILALKAAAIGALAAYISDESVTVFQPMNVNFGIMPPLGCRIKGKRNKNAELSRRSLEIIDSLRESVLDGVKEESHEDHH